ncbi:DMT family transporter [Planktothrix pseudagardhii]|uniref:Membrane protein YvaE n=1 Tax=Planktothrix pseudagardhii TaxID=132604 RepID=A0A9W4CSM9_9CYAN|nr:multidrug efflux SMR transporter [Planktothrix pseudagardhii]CAD5982068.1 putative membrane protein YvaE [Planktothrix pseudagardhii]
MESISGIYLILGIVFEVMGTTCMKLSQGFTRIWPSIGIFIFYGLSFTCLTIVLKKIEVSLAYSVWSGLGTALIAMIGIVFFRESITSIKFISIALIIIGVIGLNSGK